uniref:Transmembrane protein n=1 Tax=Mesocestoides corti TaxID=53468 RepID=A0A5K3FRV9_MESCO
MDEMQYIMSGVASVVDSDERRLTCSSGFWLVNKACSVVPVFYLLGLGYSTAVTYLGVDILDLSELSQFSVALRLNGQCLRQTPNQRK